MKNQIANRSTIFAIVAVVLMLFVFQGLSYGQPPGTMKGYAALSGAQEVPVLNIDAAGTASLELDADGNLHFNITVTGLSGSMTGAHFHGPAPEGQNAPVIFGITNTFVGNHAEGVWEGLTDEQMGYLKGGLLYLNVHTQAHPGGEIRGQVHLGMNGVAMLSGDAEVPPLTVDAAGTGAFKLVDEGTGLWYQITITGLSGPITGAHFHGPASEGQNASVIFGITNTFKDNHAEGVWKGLTAEQLQWLLDGQIYANVHTAAHPGGEIRGQVMGLQLPVEEAETDANKAVVRRWFEEIWNEGQLAVVDEIIAPNYVRHQPPNPDIHGPEGLKQVVSTFRAAFSDLHLTVEDQIAEGDKVAVRWVGTGTHQSEFQGIPPTGVQATTTGINIFRIAGGQIEEDWVNFDLTGLLQQLGVIPPTGNEQYTWGEPLEVVGDPGDPEINKALDRRFIEEAFNKGNLAVIDEIFSPTYLRHEPPNPDQLLGIEGFKQFVTVFRTAFPDLQLTLEEQIAEGGNVVPRFSFRGTHTGEFLGIPPTGKPVTVTGISIHRFADGKLVESWTKLDQFGLLLQLGVIPPPGPPLEAPEIVAYGYAVLHGDQEVPPVAMEADGTAALRLNAEGNLHFNITVTGLSGAMTGAHFHGPAPEGQNASVIFGITNTFKGSHAEGVWEGLTQEQMGYLMDGQLYLNVHTQAHPGGEIRGQVHVGTNGVAELEGDAEVPPITVDAAGTGAFKLVDDGTGLWYQITVTGLSGPITGAHFHGPAPEGQNASVIFGITNTFKGNHAEGVWKGLTDEQLKWLLDGMIYANVHTTAHPGGEIRGQVEGLQIPPKAEALSVFDMNLAPGLNMISLPLMPPEPYTAGKLASQIGATVVIKLDAAMQRFVGFTADSGGEGFPIEGGQGYIVNVPNGGAVKFTGTAWTTPPTPAAPGVDVWTTAWAFVVSGEMQNAETGSNYTVVAKNLRTGAVATDVISGNQAHFAAVWADLNRNIVVQAGDSLEITMLDARGNIVAGPFRRNVDITDIRQAYLSLPLMVGDVRPTETKLAQNFPNPFNPETWIPFQLVKSADVTIQIYEQSGRMVRTLSLGAKPAGFYTTRSTAAYWDGRNEAGERVASGVYFYTLQTQDYTATRKMLISK